MMKRFLQSEVPGSSHGLLSRSGGGKLPCSCAPGHQPSKMLKGATVCEGYLDPYISVLHEGASQRGQDIKMNLKL